LTRAVDHLYVRTDAAASTGVGHFMRCFALGQYWRDLDLNVTFIGRCPGELRGRLEQEGIGRLALDTPCPDPRDLATTLDRIPGGAITVLDGYHFDENYQQQLSADHRLMVIDDHGHLPGYAGSVLLNANLDARDVRYLRAPARRLLGPGYALLRRELRAARSAARDVPTADRATRVLVSCGGSDPLNLTLPILEALAHCADPPAEARVLVGPLNPHRASLEAFARTRSWVALLAAPRDVAPHMLWAELAVAAAGTTTWELAVCGVPSILVAAADNQIPVARAMHRQGAALFAGDGRALDKEAFATLIENLIGDPERRRQLGATARALVDGDGVVRATNVLRETVNNAHR
jgi:UDP-2,4-diacetamido-2,4,6-trideoxy-beta-L-altropyranose hydrolase